MTQASPSALPLMTPALIERFNGYILKGVGCWTWRGPLRRGYGMFYFGYNRRPAHRLSWELEHGVEIDPDLVIDHLCRNTACVNPSHLDAVPQRTNVLRGMGPSGVKTRRIVEDGVCVRGHDVTKPEAWYHAPSGERRCRACADAYSKARYQRRKQELGIPDRTGRICDVEGCTAPHSAKGMCRTHYDKWRKSGRPSR